MNPFGVAAFLPSYCMKKDSKIPALTWMNQRGCEEGVKLLKNGQADYVILSTAYSTWQEEAELKRKIFVDAGIPFEKLFVIGPVEDSYDEAEQTEKRMAYHGTKKLIVVADSYHAPRAIQAFKLMYPNINVVGHTFKTRQFDAAYEPHSIKLLGDLKSWRSAHKIPWIMWNCALLAANPLFVSLHLRKLRREGKLRASPYR